MTCWQQHSIVMFIQMILRRSFQKKKKSQTIILGLCYKYPILRTYKHIYSPYIVPLCIPGFHFIVIAVFCQDAGN